jgi:DNA polymerase-3 subunit delta
MSDVHLLLGPEQGEKDRFVRDLIDRIHKEAGEAPAVTRVYPFDASVVDIVATLRNRGLFASHHVVIINDIDLIKGQADTALIAEYCANPSPQSTLILLSSQVRGISQRIERAVPKSCRRIFWELFENRKQDWIRSFFRQRGIRVGQGAIDLILEMVENNTRELENTCGRLATYFGEDATLQRENLEGFLYHGKEENVFSLFDHLAQHDLEGSLEILEKILLARESDPIGIIAGILWQVRRAHRVSELIGGGLGAEQALTRMDIRSKRIQRIYRTAASHYSTDQLAHFIVLLEQTDRKIRTSRSELHRLLLQLLLCRMMSREQAA